MVFVSLPGQRTRAVAWNYVNHRREDFYDHFLDGAAGVMYTSFLGLILDDLIALGTGKYKKC